MCVFFSSLQNPNLCFHDIVINIYQTLNVRIIFVRTLSFKFLTLVNIFVGCCYLNNRLVPSNPSRPFDSPKVGGPVPLTGHLDRAGHLPPARHSPLEQTTGRLFLVQTLPPFRGWPYRHTSQPSHHELQARSSNLRSPPQQHQHCLCQNPVW